MENYNKNKSKITALLTWKNHLLYLDFQEMITIQKTADKGVRDFASYVFISLYNNMKVS